MSKSRPFLSLSLFLLFPADYLPFSLSVFNSLTWAGEKIPATRETNQDKRSVSHCIAKITSPFLSFGGFESRVSKQSAEFRTR